MASAEPGVRTRRFRRAEYERLVGLGLFTGERLELLDGRLVVREPQGSRHAAAIRRARAVLGAALGHAWQVDSQLPLALDEHSEPEPDIAVVAPDPSGYRDAHPTRAVLVVEIADASYRFDREHKASLYARAGIPECWIVDLGRDTVEVHRAPRPSTAAPYGWRYASVAVLRPPAAVEPLAAPGARIPVGDLLP